MERQPLPYCNKKPSLREQTRVHAVRVRDSSDTLGEYEKVVTVMHESSFSPIGSSVNPHTHSGLKIRTCVSKLGCPSISVTQQVDRHLHHQHDSKHRSKVGNELLSGVVALSRP